jgi:hypothetical protein
MKTLNQRNNDWYTVLFELFNLKKKRNSWEDIGKQINLDKISLAYKEFSTIFPREGNYYDLLPERDLKFRSIMFGDLTGNSIINYTARYSIYSDEILVIHPLQNPSITNEDLSPIKKPRMWLTDFLNSLYFYLSIYKWVKEGIVKLIVNPVKHDPQTHQSIIDIAERRMQKHGDLLLNDDVLNDALKMTLDNLALYLGKYETKKIRESLAVFLKGVSKNQIRKHTKYIKENFIKINPLYQFLSFKPESEILSLKQGANLEEILLISDLTGSHIYSPTKTGNLQISTLGTKDFWTKFGKTYSQIPIRFLDNVDIEVVRKIRNEDRLAGVRVELNKLYGELENKDFNDIDEEYFIKFTDSFREEIKKAEAELGSIYDKASRSNLLGIAAIIIALPAPTTVSLLPFISASLKLIIDQIYTNNELKRKRVLNPFTVFSEIKTPKPNFLKDLRTSLL